MADTQEEVEEALDVVTTVITFVGTVAILLLALAFRRYRAQQAASRKADPADAIGAADAAHVANVLAERVAAGDGVTMETMLNAVTSAPAMRRLGERALRLERRSLRRLHGMMQKTALVKAGVAERAPEDGEGAVHLLLGFQLRTAAAEMKRALPAGLEELHRTAAIGAGYVLSSSFNHCCAKRWLEPALATHALQAGLRAGVWSDVDPACLQLVREQAGGSLPEVGVSAAAQSWLGQPVIGVGSAIEVTVTVERRHAGSTAPHTVLTSKKVTRGHDLVDVTESYRCFLEREVDGAGGGKGSLVGIVDVDVDDPMASHVTSTMKMTAPQQPGTYRFRVHLRTDGLVGMRAEASCEFEVVGADHPALQQDDNDDYD